MLSDITVTIKIPTAEEDPEIVGEDFEIKFIFADDHDVEPMQTDEYVKVIIIAEEKYELDDVFDSLNRGQATQRQQDNLPVPTMTLEKMDMQGRIKVQFNQDIIFNSETKEFVLETRRYL